MRKSAVRCCWLLLLAFPGVSFAQGIIVDHTSIDMFDQIPDQYLQAARNLRVLFMDRSVGVNTNEALECLTSADYGSSRVICRRDFRETNGSWAITTHTNSTLANGQVHPYIRFSPSPARYNRSNWRFFIFADTWDKMTTNFISGLNAGAIPAADAVTNQALTINPMDYDVISFQFAYLNIDRGSTIGDFFTRRPGQFDDVYDLEREVDEHLTTANPRRIFVYWTTSLARGIGTTEGAAFNARMRQWCRENNRVLFDFADILAHDMYGRPCYDNRDGVPYTTPSGGASENYPDDGQAVPAICQEKTTEVDGGHLATAQGYLSVAKGFWLTIARIAGWTPGSTGPPSAPANLRVVP